MNPTTRSIIDRLPKKPLLSPGDLAAAFGLATSNAIIADIKTGKLGAVVIGGKYIVARDEAARYVEASEYSPEEGTLP